MRIQRVEEIIDRRQCQDGQKGWINSQVLDPHIQKGREGTQDLDKERILSAGSGEGAAQLSVTQSKSQVDKPGDNPEDESQRYGSAVGSDSSRGDEDSGSDDDPGHDGRGVTQVDVSAHAHGAHAGRTVSTGRGADVTGVGR